MDAAETISGQELHVEEGALSISFRLAENETKCLLSALANQGRVELSADILTQALKNHGILTGIDAEAVSICCLALRAGRSLEDFLVAKGALPADACDAFIDYKVQPTRTVAEYATTDDGGVDYHSANLFENVRAGETIAVLQPAVPGKEGRTVKGRALPAANAPGHVPTMNAGDGVELQNNGAEAVACIDGHVVMTGDSISVSDELCISGDVNHETGNIDFVGNVVIHGDIYDDFNVRAEKNLRIDKRVGCCDISAGGDISLGGMTGIDGRGSITCGGNLKARYLHETVVTCEGDIAVDTEIMGCKIKCGGHVIVGRLIAGGECTAFNGIESGRMGTNGNVKTLLTAGVDYRRENHLASLHAKRDAGAAELAAKIKDREKRQAAGNASAADKELVTLQLFEIDDLKARCAAIEEEIVEARNEVPEIGNAKINVCKEIHPGVALLLGRTTLAIENEKRGQFSIVESSGNELRFGPLTPLSKRATTAD